MPQIESKALATGETRLRLDVGVATQRSADWPTIPPAFSHDLRQKTREAMARRRFEAVKAGAVERNKVLSRGIGELDYTDEAFNQDDVVERLGVLRVVDSDD